jgi:hypothetical protein
VFFPLTLNGYSPLAPTGCSSLHSHQTGVLSTRTKRMLFSALAPNGCSSLHSHQLGVPLCTRTKRVFFPLAPTGCSSLHSHQTSVPLSTCTKRVFFPLTPNECSSLHLHQTGVRLYAHIDHHTCCSWSDRHSNPSARTRHVMWYQCGTPACGWRDLSRPCDRERAECGRCAIAGACPWRRVTKHSAQ